MNSDFAKALTSGKEALCDQHGIVSELKAQAIDAKEAA